MYYRDIKLRDYRNYRERAFEFHEKVNILIGENGRGKTNLLEAIYLTSYGKSFRTNNDKELIKFGEDFCKVNGRFRREITGKEDNEIEIILSKEGKRKGKVNGLEFHKFSDIFDNVLAVIFSPEDLKIIKESPEKRRNFIDRELSQLNLSYYTNLINYKKVLQQRNAFLKEEKREKAMLSVWDESLVDYGSKLCMQRYLFLKKLNRICKETHKNLTGEREEIKLIYSSNIISEKEQEEIFKEKEKLNHTEREKARQEIGKIYKEKIEKTREGDFINRYTGKGPQKDDIDIYVNDINIRNYGSQGQQRTAALSMKLAEIELVKEEKGEYPILLLDDVLSELDIKRQSYLINSLDRVQLFITTTNIPREVEKKLPKGKKIAI